MSDYEATLGRLAEGYERIKEAFEAALNEAKPVLEDWRDAVSDAVGEIDRIVRRNAHPDDVATAREAMSCLAGVVFTGDEIEEIYLGGEEP